MTHEASTAGTMNSSNGQHFHTSRHVDTLLSKYVPCPGPSSPWKSLQEEVIISVLKNGGWGCEMETDYQSGPRSGS